MKKLSIKITLTIFAFFALITSCTNEVTYNPVKITAVWTNQIDTFKLYGQQHQISSMKVGNWIRLDGTGFTGTKKIVCNGVSAPFYQTYVTDNNLTFLIPSTTPVPGDSTITVITNHGEYTLKPFIFK